MSARLAQKMQEQDHLDADECVELAQWFMRTGQAKRDPRIDQWCADVLDDMGGGRW